MSVELNEQLILSAKKAVPLAHVEFGRPFGGTNVKGAVSI